MCLTLVFEGKKGNEKRGGAKGKGRREKGEKKEGVRKGIMVEKRKVKI